MNRIRISAIAAIAAGAAAIHAGGGTFKGCVLLLDEPGMHLHPGGQDDLLGRFDAYARDNTLIYTTHLPFLVDIREPSRIHVMKERQDRSATVSTDLGAACRA
jgi:predicted ATP-dependent endonuclease of OLD family